MNTTRPIISANINACDVELLLGRFASSTSLQDSRSAGILSVNAQARRLGCLIYLVGLVASGRRLRSLLMAPSPSELADLESHVRKQGFTAGFLTAARSSFRHYADAVVKLNLLVQQGELFELTARGRFLAAAIKPDWRRPYPLAPEVKVFFLHLILASDYLGIAAILRSLLQDGMTSSDIKRGHQSQLASLLELLARTTRESPRQHSARDRLLSLRDWKNPASYCEHLVSAKLNWLADLGIVRLPSSPTVPLSVTEEHRPWLENWIATVDPNDAHLLALLLSFAQIVVPTTVSASSDTRLSVLETAFARLAPASGLAKLRFTDFVLFLACFHPQLVTQWIGSRETIFPESRFSCGNATYTVQSAARSTQSYVLREDARA